MYVLRNRSGPSSTDLIALEMWYRPGDHYVVASDAGKEDARSNGYTKVSTLGYVWPPPGSANATARFGLPSISRDDPAYTDQDYWHGRIWGPMIPLVYWGLEQYSSVEAKAATTGLVTQSRNLLLKNWRPQRNFVGGNSAAGQGGYVFENYGADTGEGFAYSSSATPLYSWGGLTGFIGLKHSGFYAPLGDNETP
jgi:hypothetical protein